MSEKYKSKVKGELYFITITVIDWVDLLTRPLYKELIIDALKYGQTNKGLQVHAYVIMSNHWHAIISSEEGKLEDIMRDLKKFTSKQLVKMMSQVNESRREWMLKKFEFAAKRVKKGVNFKIWQDGYLPIHLSSNEMIDDRLNYIHQNPVEEGYVYEPEHYVYSSAKDYAGLPGLIALQMLE